MKREDFEQGIVSCIKGNFGKPDLNRVDVGGRSLMAEGIPQPFERIDRFAFAMEFISGRPLLRGEPLPSSFFSDLEQVLREVHKRGVVHSDLRHKGNILLSERGEPFLIDFNSSFAFKEKGFRRRYLFPLLQWVDYGGLLKLKQRVSPSSIKPEEAAFLKRLHRLRKFWC